MKIEAGKSYVNGWGSEVPIVKAPDDRCRWFLSELGHGYHETGEMVGVGTMPEFNLVSPAMPQEQLDEQARLWDGGSELIRPADTE